MGITKSVGRGAAITVASQATKMLIQFGSIVWLARLLTPSDYGTLASALVLIGFGEVLRDAGLSTASIQAKQISAEQQTTLFWINVLVGLLLTASACFLAHPVANFFSNAEVEGVIKGLSGSFLIGALGAQYRASLTRGMSFKKLAFSDLFAQVSSILLAAGLAHLGFGVWSLVFQYLAQSSLVTLMNMSNSTWSPVFRLQRNSQIGSMVRFGLSLLGTQIIGTAAKSADSTVVGKLLGTDQLGYYNRGYQVISAPFNQLTIACTSFALPILSRLNGPEFIRTHQALQRAVLLVLFLTLTGVALASETVLPILLGEKWRFSAEITELLSLALMIQAAAYPSYWVFLSNGHTGKLLKLDILLKPTQIFMVFVGGFAGVTGIIATMGLGSFIAWRTYSWQIARLGIDLRESNKDAALILIFFLAPSATAVFSSKWLSFSGGESLAYKAACFLTTFAVLTCLSRRMRNIIASAAASFSAILKR